MEQVKRKNIFRNRNFTLVFLGALVSNVAALFYSFAVSFYILTLTDNNAFIQGLYLAIGGIVYCIASLFGGGISDRFDKAKIMYICDYIKGFVIIGFTLLFMFVINSNSIKVISLFIITIILNVIAGIFSPASSALLPQIVEEDDFQQAQSYFSILGSFQSIVGVFLAGILYSLIPIDILFLIVGICYIGSAISEMFIKYEHEKTNENISLSTMLNDIKSGFTYFISVKPIFILMMGILVLNFFFSPFYSNFIPYFIVSDVTGADYFLKELITPELWSSLFSIGLGIGSLIVGFIFSLMKQREKYAKLIKLSLILVSFIFVIDTLVYYLFSKDFITINILLISFFISFVLIGGLLIMINVPGSTAMMKMIDKDNFGKVSSVINISSQGLIPFSTFLAGICLTHLGSFGLLLICSLGVLAASILISINRSIDEI